MERIVYTGDKPNKEIFQIFCETMEELFGEDENVVYIDADLMHALRATELWEKYPNKVINTGVQEANMIGVAAGMYLYGKKPYVHSFAPFATRRCFDQTYISIGYAHKGIRIIGSEPGISATDNGGTHMTFEDVALMRMIPNSLVFDVSDGTIFKKILKATKDEDRVVYIRTPRRGLPDLYPENVTFEIGKGKLIREGTDCTVIASGIMTATALDAAKELQELGISIEVIDPISIKPIDEAIVLESVRKTGKVITIENHSVCGGLGGSIAEILSEKCPVKIHKIGIREEYGQVGSMDYLREYYGLRTKDLVQEIRAFVCSQ